MSMLFRFFLFFLLISFVFSQEKSSKEPYEMIYYIVNEDIITKIDFEEEKKFSSSVNVLQNQNNSSSSPDKIMSNFIISKLMEQELNKTGIEVTAIDITNQIRTVMGANGITEIEQFEQLLAAQGVSFSDYFKFNKRQAVMQQFATKLLIVKPPSKEEMLSYYSKNKEIFKVTNTIVNVQIILSLIDESATFSERIEGESKMKNIIQELADGLAFEEAVLKYSEDNKSKFYKGDLGWLSYFNINEKGITLANLKTLTQYKVGEITDAIPTSRGLGIFKINDKKKDGYYEFEAIKSQVNQILFLEKQNEKLQKKIKELIDSSNILSKTDKFENVLANK